MKRSLSPHLASLVRVKNLLLLSYLSRMLVGVVVAYPFAKLASKTLGAWPDYDSSLFDPGAYMLLEVLRMHEQAVSAHLTQAIALTILFIPLNFALSTITWVALASPPTVKLPMIVARTTQRMVPSIIVAAFFTTLMAIVVALTWAVQAALDHNLHAWFGYRGGDLASLAVYGLGAILFLTAFLAGEVSRAHAASGQDAPSAILNAFSVIKRHPFRLPVALWCRLSMALFLVLLGSVLAQRTNLRTTPVFVCVLASHQIVALLLVLLKASWQERVLQVAGSTEAGTSER